MPKPKRIFIAINLPQQLTEKLARVKNNWPGLPCRWVEAKNLHITLIFLGNTGEKELQKIEKTVESVVDQYRPFPVELVKICYGPPKKIPPFLVWIQGESEKLVQLKKDLDRELAQKISYRPEKRRYIPHITLGRIKKFEWRRLNIEQRPKVSLNLEQVFKVNSVEIMESNLKRSGPEYTTVKSVRLEAQ